MWWGKAINQYLPRPSFMAMAFLVIGAIIHLGELDWSFSRREYELYLFLGMIFLSSFVFGIGVQDDSWVYIVKMAKMFVFIFLLIRVVHSLHDYNLLVWIFIISTLFLSYEGHTVSAGYYYKGRLEFIGGVDFGEANGVAAVSAIGTLFLGLGILYASTWWKKSLYLLGTAFTIDTIILTQSRGVFAGLLIVIPYILLWAPSQYRKKICIFAGVGIVLFVTLVSGNFMTRMKTMSEELEYDQEERLSRTDYWRTSLQIFKDHPLGIGVKNFQKIVTAYDPRNPGMDAHNTYVICYSETGILGIILFLIIIAETFLQLRRIHLMAINLPENEITFYALALGGALIVYLTGYGMTHTTLYKEILWILLALPICLENVARNLLSEASQEIYDSEL